MSVFYIIVYLFGGAVLVSMIVMFLWMLFLGLRNCFGLYRETVGTMKPGFGKFFLTVAFILAILVALVFVRW